jgi:hypothetical protein
MLRNCLTGFLVLSVSLAFFPGPKRTRHGRQAAPGLTETLLTPNLLLAREAETAGASLLSPAPPLDLPGPAISKIDIPPLPLPISPTLLSPKLKVDSRVEQALALIKYPWQDLGFEIVALGRRTGYRAMTLIDERRIEVYERAGETPDLVAFDLAHEFGHAFDLKYNDDQRRLQWKRLRGIRNNTPWFGCNGCPDYSTPAGDFAETFAYLLLGPGSYHSRMAPAPAQNQVAELASFCKIQNVSEALLPEKREDSGNVVAIKVAHAK